MTATKRKEHTFFRYADDGSSILLSCANCGREETYLLPISARRLSAIVKSFNRDHRSCKPRKDLS